MKKKITIAIVCLLIAVSSWMLFTGYSIQSNVYITDDFTVSNDGTRITFHAAVSSPMGYIRGFKDEGGGVKPHYLKFYSAWGGLNSSLGAQDEYTLELDSEDTEVYVSHGDEGFDLVFQKDTYSGIWEYVY